MDGLLVVVLVVLGWLFVQGSQSNDSGNDPYTNDYPGNGEADALNPTLDQISQAVARVESGNRQTDANGRIVTSPVGALGIMQLMPSTAQWLGVDPYDAQQNFAGGQKYLGMLYQKYGNWNDALAAYNWGPGHVDNALSAGTSYPTSVQGYVQKVLSFLGLN